MSEFTSKQQLLDAVRSQRAETERVIAAAGDRVAAPGSAGHWSVKELLTHLTGWQKMTAARLEAGLNGGEPVQPWPESLGSEDENVDAINAWFEEQDRDRSAEEVIAESRETLGRIEAAITQLSDADLFEFNRFPWLEGYQLGSGVIEGMTEHFREHREEDLRALLGS